MPEQQKELIGYLQGPTEIGTVTAKIYPHDSQEESEGVQFNVEFVNGEAYE